MRLPSTTVARALARGLVVAITASVAAAATFVPASANGNYLGVLSAGRPASPPFVFSPNVMPLDSHGLATITFQIVVKNKTSVPQTMTLEFGVHHILTYNGVNIANGQPGQPGHTFVKGDAPNTTQELVGLPQFVTMTFPPRRNGPTTLTFTQSVNQCGYFQVDVGQHKGLHKEHANLSSGFTRVLGCSERFTPGYWKNHQAATTALLPIKLGNYTVSTFSQATAVFAAMKCSSPSNCLAGHLLAAKLDIANGSSNCIAPTVTAADNLLKAVPWNGPTGSYTLSSTVSAQAISLESALDNYTNDSSSMSC